MEEGETFESAAVREVIEECGIRSMVKSRVFTVTLRADTVQTHVTAGVVGFVSHDAYPTITEPAVFDEWRWVRPDNLPSPLFPATAVLLDAWTGTDADSRWRLYPSATTEAKM